MKKTFTLLMIFTFLSIWAVAQKQERGKDPLRFNPDRISQTQPVVIHQKSLVFYEDFSGATIPQGWQNIARGTPGYRWVHAGSLFNFVYIDSDAADEDANVAGSLITPAIDCSGMTNVLLGMYHMFWHNDNDVAKIRISTNGADFEDAFVFTSSVGDNSYPYFEYDISAFAAGHSTVYIEFY